MAAEITDEQVRAATRASMEAERAALVEANEDPGPTFDEWEADPSLSGEGWPIEKALAWQRAGLEAAIGAVDEKRRELAQAVPEGQEYAYRVCWEDAVGPARSAPMAIGRVDDFKEALAPVLRPTIWVERALLGTWEKLV